MRALAAACLVVVALTGCAVDSPIAPRPLAPAPSAAVLPASAYKVRDLVPWATYAFAYAVNDQGTAVGTADQLAFFGSVATGTRLLPTRRVQGASAYAINDNEVVAGAVANPVWTPALWLSTRSLPLVFPFEGTFYGINDRAEVVGERRRRGGHPVPFYYEASSGIELDLPLPKGAIGGRALDINEDRVIVGVVYDVLAATPTRAVMWRPTATGFSARDLSPLATANAVDHGYTIAGATGQLAASQAAWGAPTLGATIPVVGAWAQAWGINTYKTIVGTAGDWGWVADQSGNVTTLPVLPTTLRSEARAINTCGLIVGWNITGNTTAGATRSVATAWDPGC